MHGYMVDACMDTRMHGGSPWDALAVAPNEMGMLWLLLAMKWPRCRGIPHGDLLTKVPLALKFVRKKAHRGFRFH